EQAPAGRPGPERDGRAEAPAAVREALPEEPVAQGEGAAGPDSAAGSTAFRPARRKAGPARLRAGFPPSGAGAPEGRAAAPRAGGRSRPWARAPGAVPAGAAAVRWG